MSGLDVELDVPGRLRLTMCAEPGDVVAVVGPNGAGKTTLVSAVAGLLPVRGHVRLDGRDLREVAVRERDVGLVFQDQRLFPHLSALENVAFGPRARGTARGEARERAQAWLDRLDVGHLADRRPGQLSGGQAQRVAIARALVTDPALLLLDEPMAGLDVGVAASLRLELGSHLDAFSGVTLLVTHDALDALTLADRVLVLDDGEVAQEGTPQEVSARPRTEHVARLVGLNVVREGDRLTCFRPSAVSVSRGEPAGSERLRWRGVVRSAVPHGDAVRLGVETDGGAGPDLLADLTPMAVRELDLVPGADVWLAVKQTAADSYPDRVDP